MIEIGAWTWAHSVKPGMIVELASGRNYEVGKVVENYSTVTLVRDGGYESTEVDYAAQLTVRGYFNPEPLA